MSANDTNLSIRPPIKYICFSEAEDDHRYTVGSCGVTEIKETQECGEYSHIPWVEVWAGEKLLARFSQHKLDGIFYE